MYTDGSGPVLTLPIFDPTKINRLILRQGEYMTYLTERHEGRQFVAMAKAGAEMVTIRYRSGGSIKTAQVKVEAEPAVWDLKFPRGASIKLPNNEGSDGFSSIQLAGTSTEPAWMYFPDEDDNISPEVVRFSDVNVESFERANAKHKTWCRTVFMPDEFSCPDSNMGIVNVWFDENENVNATVIKYRWLKFINGQLLVDSLGANFKTVSEIQNLGVSTYWFNGLRSLGAAAIQCCWTFERDGTLISGAINFRSQTADEALGEAGMNLVEDLYPSGVIKSGGRSTSFCTVGLDCRGDPGVDEDDLAPQAPRSANYVPPQSRAVPPPTYGQDMETFIYIALGSMLLLMVLNIVISSLRK